MQIFMKKKKEKGLWNHNNYCGGCIIVVNVVNESFWQDAQYKKSLYNWVNTQDKSSCKKFRYLELNHILFMPPYTCLLLKNTNWLSPGWKYISHWSQYLWWNTSPYEHARWCRLKVWLYIFNSLASDRVQY